MEIGFRVWRPLGRRRRSGIGNERRGNSKGRDVGRAEALSHSGVNEATQIGAWGMKGDGVQK